MVNVFQISIGQDDCPHTLITGKIPGLMIFVMNTSDESGGYQRTFSIFLARDEIDLRKSLNMLKAYANIRDINLLGMKDNMMSLTYSFPRTSAYNSIKRIGFRLHPVVIRNGEEKWFFVTYDDKPINDSKAVFNDHVTRLVQFSRLTTNEFINTYSRLFNEIWKLRIDMETKGRGTKIISEALNSGYYDWPRKASLSKLSKIMDMPRTTLTYRLRKLEKSIFEDLENRE